MNLLAILFIIGACYFAPAGELSDLYSKNVHTNPEEWQKQRIRSPQAAMVATTNLGIITEIGIERTACFGKCPVYTFVVRRDGTFRYKGEKYVQHLGEFSGTIPADEFDRLAQFIKDAGYMDLSDTYDRAVTDNATVFTMVVMNGKQKVISDYAGAGPSKLWAIEQLIDDLVGKAQWEGGLPKAPAPILPAVTRYDYDPVLRMAYLESFRKGYNDAWERKEKLPVFGPTNDVDKARVLGYGEGSVAGRAALATWFGTNSPATNLPGASSLKR